MAKIKKTVEIDVDGVLANNLGNNYIKNKLRDIYPDWSDSHIKKYGLPDIREKNPEAYRILIGSFHDPFLFRSMPAYPGVVEGMRLLAESDQISIRIHTLVWSNPDVVKARKSWIEDLIRFVEPRSDLREKMDIEYQIDVGTKVMFKNMDYLIEDCPDNLMASDAKNKILIKKSYNEDFALTNKSLVVAKSFLESVRYILDQVEE